MQDVRICRKGEDKVDVDLYTRMVRKGKKITNKESECTPYNSPCAPGTVFGSEKPVLI